MGDFNIDLLPTAVQKTSWINTFQSYYLNQLIDEPTRITSHSKTLLDHIYVSEVRMFPNQVYYLGLLVTTTLYILLLLSQIM